MFGGLAQDIFAPRDPGTEAKQGEDPNQHRQAARIMEVSGLALIFVAIYGAAGWKFYHRKREDEPDRAPFQRR